MPAEGWFHSTDSLAERERWVLHRAREGYVIADIGADHGANGPIFWIYMIRPEHRHSEVRAG